MTASMSVPIRLIDVKLSLYKEKIVYITNTAGIVYSALSHVWSTLLPARTHAGVKWQVSAFIERNMKNVLQIINKCGIYALWVDAYCINQSDEEEKAKEIIRVGSYYNNAYSVVILPNGVDNMYRNSIIFGKWKRHWCMWTQKVWTLLELSVAKTAIVICCLDIEQAIRVKNIRQRDLNKQFFPVHIIYWYNTKDKEIVVTDLDGYCNIVGLKLSGYLDGTSDTNDSSDNHSIFIEQTKMTLSKTQGDQNINRWIHRITTRECQYEVDRIYTIIPILNVKLDVSNSYNSLDELIQLVFEKLDKQQLLELVLSTRESDGLSMTFYPIIKKIKEDEIGSLLVHTNEKINVDDEMKVHFNKSKGLLLTNVLVAQNVKIKKYIYEHREFSSDDEEFGNTAYDLQDNNLPCSVGKCNPNYETIDLVKVGTTNVTLGDKFRMLELKVIGIDLSVLVCCLACTAHGNTLQKVGVLLVEENIFDKLNKVITNVLIK